LLLLVLGSHNFGASVPASGEGVAEDDKMLLNCLEHVSYAKIFIWLDVPSLCFVFPLGTTFDKVSDCREIRGGAVE
jgi:hypothetical protein